MTDNYSSELDALEAQVGETESTGACVDDSAPIQVVDRDIQMPGDCVYAVCCDANSQLLTFQVPRHYDGIDLYSKVASIKFKNALGQSDRAVPYSVGADDDMITLAWLLDGNVTAGEGTVHFQLEFYEMTEGAFYSWQTKPKTFEVLPTLNVDGELADYVPTWVQAVSADLDAVKKSVADLTENKVDKVPGKGLSTNDFTYEHTLKLFTGYTNGEGVFESDSLPHVEPRLKEGVYKITAPIESDDHTGVVGTAAGYLAVSHVSARNEEDSLREHWTQTLIFNGDVITRNVRIDEYGMAITTGWQGIAHKQFASIGASSFAVGLDNVAGQKAYYIKSIDADKKIIYLSSATNNSEIPVFSTDDNTDESFETPAYEIGHYFSIITGGHYNFCGVIKSIQNNVVKYTDDLPFNVFANNDLYFDDNSFFVPSKPEVGLVCISQASFAEGRENIAGGSYSHSEGCNNISSGNFSHTEGLGNKAGYIAHAEGNLTKAVNTGAHAEGVRTTATGHGSHAEGVDTVAEANASHAEGTGTKAKGLNGSHAEGYHTNAVGDSSHSEGMSTLAEGYSSHAEGCETKTFGKYAHAEGWKTEAHGHAAHAEGISTKAESNYSHTEGQSTNAKGIGAHAEGYGTKAFGDYSHAEGKNCRASGVASHAGGLSCATNADYAEATGMGTIASSEAQKVFGKYNVEDKAGKYALIIGGGTSSSDRKNILTVDWQGNVEATGNLGKEIPEELLFSKALGRYYEDYSGNVYDNLRNVRTAGVYKLIDNSNPSGTDDILKACGILIVDVRANSADSYYEVTQTIIDKDGITKRTGYSTNSLDDETEFSWGKWINQMAAIEERLAALEAK